MTVHEGLLLETSTDNMDNRTLVEILQKLYMMTGLDVGKNTCTCEMIYRVFQNPAPPSRAQVTQPWVKSKIVQ